MQQRVDGIVMLSGGLDSMVTAHLLKSLGLNIIALHYMLPFYSRLGLEHAQIKEFAALLGIPLLIEEEGEEFMEMIKSPVFGYGKNANPCLDCRIHRLTKAKKIMEQYGASFIATGEVNGQRPMSQRMECLHVIEKKTGLQGRLLRPLSAHFLPETIPEKEGLVDRSKLLAISGRGRKVQLAYAKKHGLKHTPPAGGCLLTNEASSNRLLTLLEKFPAFDFKDFMLVAYGRHFILNDVCRLVIAREDRENVIIEKIVDSNDLLLETADTPGPLAVLRGEIDDEVTITAAAFVARYSRLRNEKQVAMRLYRQSGEERRIAVAPATPQVCEACRY